LTEQAVQVLLSSAHRASSFTFTPVDAKARFGQRTHPGAQCLARGNSVVAKIVTALFVYTSVAAFTPVTAFAPFYELFFWSIVA
jgi:hypothetical protein